MSKLFHRATAFFLPAVLLAAGCSEDGPSGPDFEDGATRLSGRFTATQAVTASGLAEGGLGLAQGDDFVGDEALAGVTVQIVDGSNNVVFTTETDGDGDFSAELEPGTYTVHLIVGQETILSFVLDVPEDASFFVEGKVDVNPSGKVTGNFQIFRDNDGDGVPDDTFRIRIMGRVEGDISSGDVDVVASQQDIEGKATICHIPPGNPDNAHTIVVGAPALPGHLAHGDFEGECDGDEGASDNDLDDDGEDDDAGAAKVVICHFPPGNPDNPRTIEIAEDALEAHLAHGDLVGACEDVLEEGDESAAPEGTGG